MNFDSVSTSTLVMSFVFYVSLFSACWAYYYYRHQPKKLYDEISRLLVAVITFVTVSLTLSGYAGSGVLAEGYRSCILIFFGGAILLTIQWFLIFGPRKSYRPQIYTPERADSYSETLKSFLSDNESTVWDLTHPPMGLRKTLILGLILGISILFAVNAIILLNQVSP